MVCGRDNPHGLHLDLFVMPNNGLVVADYVPQRHHCGFEGYVHGGILSTLMDEAMTWAATWNIKRFCMCGELNVRFRQSVLVGQRVRVEAHVDFSRHKLVEPSAKLFDEFHKLLATATGKYVPVSPEQHAQFVRTFIESDRTLEAAALLGLRNVPVTDLTE
jgi:acyl-coenzyme A thioesterase PaaI-like protein